MLLLAAAGGEADEVRRAEDDAVGAGLGRGQVVGQRRLDKAARFAVGWGCRLGGFQGRAARTHFSVSSDSFHRSFLPRATRMET